MAGIFAEVLSLDRAGVDESFFELGGHSFLARPLIAKVNAALGTDLQVQSLFRAPPWKGCSREAAKGADGKRRGQPAAAAAAPHRRDQAAAVRRAPGVRHRLGLRRPCWAGWTRNGR